MPDYPTSTKGGGTKSCTGIIIKYSEPDGSVGIARYYKKRYNGRKTTSGEIYSSKKLTAGKYKRLDYFFTLKDFSLWSK
ncbi:hypothetical protein DS62_08550 [Smithella sp. SC_K08D17]|nr:hypothetical protein KD27_02795 [Smithella sp. D17]KIE16842.1 hypothetical protein DS62_08550 [Smithella sp. SC_K08D17]